MDATTLTTAQRRRHRRGLVAPLAAAQGGVVSRTQLYALGLTRAEVRAQLRAHRWRALGRHCVVTHTGPITVVARHWAAVVEAGPRCAVDGESSLVLAGLERYEPRAIRVSVPRGARIRHPGADVDIRQTRRWSPDDVVSDVGERGIPRTRPGVAAVRAVLWARTDRQATLVLTMAVQQQVVSPAEVAVELLRIRRDRRRGLAQGLLGELAGGIGSLGELDVTRGCRDRGLPQPESQSVRRSRTGTYYLDFRWREWGVVLEVDGVQHSWAEQLVGDALRHNAVALDGDIVLRLPVIGLRLCPDAFFDQLAAALRSRGWGRAQDVMHAVRRDDEVA